MRSSERTQGATLIVSLLLVMLLLAVIMSVTAQVTLSARRSSSDQESVLRAQLAAESGTALIQARARVMSTLLRSAQFSPADTPLVLSDLAAICGLSSMPAVAVGSDVCDLSALSGGLNEAGDARVRLLVRAVAPAAFAAAGLDGSTDAKRAAYWREMFSGAAGTSLNGAPSGATYAATYGLRPTRLTRSGVSEYRLFFSMPDAQITGAAGTTTRQVRLRAEQPGLNLVIQRPSLAPNALFTNHHFASPEAEAAGSRITFTSRTMFSGPVHTNGQFRFIGKPWFGGAVTSAGCPAGQIQTTATGDVCAVAAQPGAHFDTTFTASSAMTPSPDAPTYCYGGNPDCAGNPDVAPSFPQGVTWNAPFMQLPVNGNDQAAAAQTGGVLIPGNVTNLQLYRAAVTGQDSQRITYTTEAGVTVNLAVGANRKLRIQDGSGTWVPAVRAADGSIAPGSPASDFNGVVYVNGAVASLNAGPDPVGAAVAPFSGLTLAATGNINITSDLTYADPPCTGQHTRNADGSVTPATCANLNATNILGIYSSTGNVNLISPKVDATSRLGNNPNIHAVMMAGTGAVQVSGYGTGAPMGNVNLIGGIIENYYGAFGTTSGNVQQTGYGRNFVFDPRTLAGVEPPFFPTSRTWTMALVTTPTGTTQPTEPIDLRGDTVSEAP
ncbi:MULTISPECIES: DUF4900 domain-containing protein [unclassified Deinococcus]|uniref:DUF4900 domain-containing protein n=1 Tax=unclassified Deinococcus TaxID=2623546 RepID=UPI001C2F7439|nr:MULTISPECIES: DUF4900 domain-containing protein [unclassified Deinococcus]MDK2013887.1 DUF4900 domain-containing protein [Deinococcus sp. 43]